MPTASHAAVALRIACPQEIETDVLFLPTFEGENPLTAAADLDRVTGGAVATAAETGEFQGRFCELFLTPLTREWKARRIALIGAGKAGDFDTERLRKLAAAAGLAARQRRARRMGFVLRGTPDTRLSVQTVAEGLTLASFSTDRYKSSDRLAPPVEEAIIIAGEPAASALDVAVARGRVLGDCCNLARELCNEPSNLLTPRLFAERGSAIAREAGLQVEVLGEEDIERLRMGLLLGVARGSTEPPRVLVMRYQPPGAAPRPMLGLVGKGVTFDTGGISIKPADGMDRMKDDMSGGAAVIGAMRAISILRAPVPVVGVVPMSENMPGGRALKPGDILTGASGTTVEVLNTDAEGRLILGDGLWYVRQLGATHLVDVATLTGAVAIALGRAASGLFGQPEPWTDLARRVANRAGDRCWPMPLYEEYREQLKSEIADIANVGGRPAGSCTAAMFLKEFAGDLPWAHFDIAGTAWADEPKPWQGKGPTGVLVRTLAELAFASSEWP